MRILLSSRSERGDLRRLYLRAFREADELYIASAYLTEWDHRDKLGAQCKRAVFVAGTDFGLSRKSALREVLRWTPKREGFSVRAVKEKGFHPKIVAWRTTSRRHYCIVGSSNLSRAAFSGNLEANIFCSISAADYARICDWIENIETLPVTPEWIDFHYFEAKRTPGGGPPHTPVVRFSFLPNSQGCARSVLKRRKQLQVFRSAREPFRREMSRCAKKRSNLGDRNFWRFMWPEWKNWRFQGGAIQVSAKHARWWDACASLLRILRASAEAGLRAARLDRVVRDEIDRLARNKCPVRRAWLSEMLCHYFPDLYPVNNQPVRSWLAKNRYPSRRGVSEGRYYVELAQKLREIVREHRPAGARNLAELDAAIRHEA